MKKRILATLTSLIMLTTSFSTIEVFATEDASLSYEAAVAYKTLIDNAVSQYGEYCFDAFTGEQGVGLARLIDFDGDGNSELLIGIGSEANPDVFFYEVYSYNNGPQLLTRTACCNSFDLHFSLNFEKSGEKIYAVTSSDSVCDTTQYYGTIENGQWVVTEYYLHETGGCDPEWCSNAGKDIFKINGQATSDSAAGSEFLNNNYSSYDEEFSEFTNYGKNGVTCTYNNINNVINAPTKKAANNSTITVTLDNETLEFDQNPIIVNSRTMVPLRVIFESLGASVEWDQDTQTVTSVKGNTTISMTIGKAEMVKNGTVIALDVAPQIVGDRTLVPVRAVAESFDCFVDWDSETQTVIIESTKNTLGNKLLAEFEALATDSNNALSIAETLVTSKAIAFSGGAIPVEEGYLVGFDNTEIKGFKEGAMFAPMIGTIPFVGYVFTLENEADVASFTETLKNSANLRWNICTAAEEMVVGSKGNKVFFVMCPAGLEDPEADARQSAEAFLDALVNFEFENFGELVLEPDNIPEAIKDFDALLEAAAVAASTEMPGYEEDFKEFFLILFNNIKSNMSYEITEATENNGVYTFSGTVKMVSMDAFDFDAFMQENLSESAITEITYNMVLEGKISEKTTEAELEAILMPVVFNLLKDAAKNIDFSNITSEEEFHIVVVNEGGRWLVDDANSSLEF